MTGSADRGATNLSPQGGQADEAAGERRRASAEGGSPQGEHGGNDGAHQDTSRGGIYI